MTTCLAGRAAWSRFLPSLLAVLLLLPTLATRAQTPAWSAPGSLTQATGTSEARAVATDANGNVFVTGSFRGSVAFGSTLLTSVGVNDLFVAKYLPSTGTWAWAQSGGGTNTDYGYGVAVSGQNVYVVGSFINSTTNAQGVLFGGTGTTPGTVQVNGASSTVSQDLVLAKYTDNGPTATLNWTQVGGGTDNDTGYGVAVSGQNVYVTGGITNSTTNAQGVLFGGTGTTPGTAPVNGATRTTSFDLVLAKYTDNGPTATLGWTQVDGGTSLDGGYSVAVSGPSVYVTGIITNSTTNAEGVLFGGTGTTPGTVQVNGASSTVSQDLVLAKYTDNGPTATLNWTQVGGGIDNDTGYGVAVRGTSVYVVGSLVNSSTNAQGVLFGGTGTTPGTAQVNGAASTASFDVVLAKYIDNGPTATLGWTQVGGGTNNDTGFGVAVSGQNVYVTGIITNSTTNAQGVLFGGTGTTPGTTPVNGVTSTTSLDLVLVKYTDNGPSATLGWTQVGGGPNNDVGYGVAVSGQNVLVASAVTPGASFGSYTIATPIGSGTAVLARLVDNTLTPLPVRSGALGSAHGLALFPNPARHGAATLTSQEPGVGVRVLDALGRVVATATTDLSGTVAFGRLAPGLYLVRVGTSSVRLAVE